MFNFSRFKLLALVVLSVTLYFGSIGGCSGSSTSGTRVRISGFVLSVDGETDDVAGIKVAVVNPGNGERRSGVQTTNADGAYSLNVNVKGRSEVLTLIFTSGLEVFSDTFIFTRGSEIVLNVSLAGSGDVEIADNDYEVVQGRISLDGDRSFVFVNAIGLTTPARANLTILGGGNTCMRLRDTSSVIIGVRNFIMDTCGQGINATNSSVVTIDASVNFEIQSLAASVEAANSAVVSLSGENNFTMEASVDLFAIVGRGTSATIVNGGEDAPSSCLITGTEGAFVTNDTATVDIPDSCEP
jgi:hypothetical protein